MRRSHLGAFALGCATPLVMWTLSLGSTAAAAAGKGAALPKGCGLAQVRGFYSQLFSAAASGRREDGLERIAAQDEQVETGPHPVFQIGETVSEGRRGRRLVSTNRPARLYKFLAWRSRGDGLMRLLSAAVSPGRRSTAVNVVFGVRIRETGKAIRQAVGKGAINCESGQFALWQMPIFEPKRTGTSCGAIQVDARRPPEHPVTCRVRY